MEKTREGGCFCGRLRYRMRGAPMFVHCCHCTDCQRQTGSAFAVNALIEGDRIEILSGEPVTVALPTGSGRPHDVVRCSHCGSAIYSDYGRRGYLLFVRVTTLDEPGGIEPDVHIYTRSKLPWVRLPEGARAFADYYDMKTEWPADSLARRQAASDGAKSAKLTTY